MIYTNDDTDFFNTNEVNAAMREANKNIFNPIARKAIKKFLFLGGTKV